MQGPSLAASLAPEDRLLLFNDGTPDPIEEKQVGALRAEDDRMILVWKSPIQNSGWTAGTMAYKSRRRFRLFGHDRPATYMKPTPNSSVPGGIRWELVTVASYRYPLSGPSTTDLFLDAKYDGLEVGRELLVDDTAGTKTRVTITRVDQSAASFENVSDTVTHLTVTPAIPAISARQTAVIYELVGPRIVFGGAVYPTRLTGSEVYLPGRFVDDPEGPGVEVGRTIERNAFKPGVILRPKELEIGREVLLTDAGGAPVAGKIDAVPTVTSPDAAGFCHLILPLQTEEPLSLETGSAVLLGNVVLASHGETVRGEAAGSGDASAKFQRLALKKKPLTYVPSATAGGVRSTLQVLVDRVLWNEVPGLFGQPPTARVYATRMADDGTVVLQFGDGVTGTPLTSGRGNVTATYRIGSGLVGRVPAGALTTLLDRPTGLREVTNPLPSDGGADPEPAAGARENAPKSVRTFGRAVSLRDFEDLVTASGLVAKAQATWVWDGLARSIYLTVAGQEGATFSDLGIIAAGLNAARDPNHRLRIANYARVPILFSATVNVDPSFVRSDVVSAAQASLLDALSFDRLRLAQPIHLSELYRVLQDVPGVLSADITKLLFKQPSGMSSAAFTAYLNERGVTRLPDGTPAPVQGHLRLFAARPDPASPGGVLPAELAWIESPTQDISIGGTGGLAP
jgi:hypothetical protein